ncbi:MAG: cytochrome P450 [Gammaproteobacteria bacterium]|nr:cytochrome P450 [Gammaproteobacteria bacterium]
MSLLEQQSLAQAEVQEHPYAYYHALHEQPIFYDSTLGCYICSRYDLMRQILRDTRVFSNVGSQTMDGFKAPPPGVAEIRRQMIRQVDTLVTNDPPAHSRCRQMVDNPFTPRKVRSELRGSIDEIVEQTIDAFIDDGECDFVKAFAEPVPLLVIADQLGVPREDAPKFKIWSDASVAPLGMMISPEEHVECTRRVKEMQDYFLEAFESRRREPRDDLLSHLLHVREEGVEPFSTEEMVSITQQLLVAGNETTTNALAAGMQLLIENPDQQRLLREDPSRIRIFVEEVLRVESPVQGLFRVVTEDVELAGVKIPKGARVMLRFAAANRDPEQYAEPDKLDVCRRNAGTHLAFGAGIHHCLGAALAREEMNSAFEQILARMDELHFLPERNDFRHYPNMILRGLQHLWIGFHKIA